MTNDPYAEMRRLVLEIEQLRIEDDKREDETLQLKTEVARLKLTGTQVERETFYAMKNRAVFAERLLDEIWANFCSEHGGPKTRAEVPTFVREYMKADKEYLDNVKARVAKLEVVAKAAEKCERAARWWASIAFRNIDMITGWNGSPNEQLYRDVVGPSPNTAPSPLKGSLSLHEAAYAVRELREVLATLDNETGEG